MNALSPVYLSAIATQIGGLSAFLGGFAATFLGTLLALGVRGRAAALSIGAAVSASVAFIVAVVASTAMVAVLHPEAPRAALGAETGGARLLLSLSFVVGLYALLASLAFSGWTRSRATGLTTSIASGLGMALVTLMIVNIG